jgi:patatin-like phospholipase/acyl hydrolase
MQQSSLMDSTGDDPHSGKELCLLSLDGGGVRGMSTLCILEELMRKVDADHPPKPCEYFDMIGGTSTGG